LLIETLPGKMAVEADDQPPVQRAREISFRRSARSEVREKVVRAAVDVIVIARDRSVVA